MNEVLKQLERWYSTQCNGSWEHQYGVRIETMDNPGWRVYIDLKDTCLMGSSMDEVRIERTEMNWLQCQIRDEVFEGFGGPENLGELISVFMHLSKHKPSF